MVDIKKILDEKGPLGKFEGVAPDGFVLVHENTLELLKDMNVWLEWKMERLSILEINNYCFDNT
jgi:hypothetical protein